MTAWNLQDCIEPRASMFVLENNPLWIEFRHLMPSFILHSYKNILFSYWHIMVEVWVDQEMVGVVTVFEENVLMQPYDLYRYITNEKHFIIKSWCFFLTVEVSNLSTNAFMQTSLNVEHKCWCYMIFSTTIIRVDTYHNCCVKTFHCFNNCNN